MKKDTVRVVQRKAKPQILHEHNSKGQHRLVLVGEENNKVSPWYEHYQIGSFEGMMFCDGGYPMQAGVFRQIMVEARHLQAREADSPACSLENAKAAQVERIRR